MHKMSIGYIVQIAVIFYKNAHKCGIGLESRTQRFFRAPMAVFPARIAMQADFDYNVYNTFESRLDYGIRI